ADGVKTSPNWGATDAWIIKTISREAPVGTPAILVNGQYSPSNRHTITNATAAMIELQSSFTNAQIFYTLDGSPPSSNSLFYYGPLFIVHSATVRVIACNSNFSASVEAQAVSVSITPIPFFVANEGAGRVTRFPDTNVYF